MGADFHRVRLRPDPEANPPAGPRLGAAGRPPPWHLGHLRRSSGCADVGLSTLAAIGQAPQLGHFTSRVSVSIILTAPKSLLPRQQIRIATVPAASGRCRERSRIGNFSALSSLPGLRCASIRKAALGLEAPLRPRSRACGSGLIGLVRSFVHIVIARAWGRCWSIGMRSPSIATGDRTGSLAASELVEIATHLGLKKDERIAS